MSKQYEAGLYRRYVAGEGLGDRATHWFEYDRDPAAERAVAAWESVRAAITLCADSLLVCIDALVDLGRGKIWHLEAARILRAIAPILKREEKEAGDAVQKG